MQSPLIELEYCLRRGAVGTMHWALWGLILAVAIGLLIMETLHVRATNLQLASLRAQWAEAREQASAVGAPIATGAPTPALDFTAGLPEVPPAADVVHMLSRICAQAGVSLVGVQATPRPGSAAQLGRTELTVLVRGPYAGARAALDGVLQRYPALTLQRLRMRRTSSPTDLETSATLSVWGRPAPNGKAS